ncbi:MAG: RNA 2',3'-cyclic phosphodiesterase [Deltaproteobacteria bacterium]|nr:MAG: RNA 2',3'-cyclic phosphodiesterase [Deltaproteobacteria bacterium]
MSEKIRAFIAIPLPESILKAISAAQEKLRRTGLGIRLVRPEGIHLTLKFLGNISPTDVSHVESAIEQATRAFRPFTLKAKGIGVFPDFRRPRVIWLGITGDLEILHALQRDLESELKSHGFEKEKRPFKGHLTLGRIRNRLDRDKLSKALQELEDFETGSFRADSVVLFRSKLHPGGAVYSKIAEAALKSA